MYTYSNVYLWWQYIYVFCRILLPQLVTTQPYPTAAAGYATAATRYAIPAAMAATGATYAAAGSIPYAGREYATDPYLGHSIGPVAGYGATVYRGAYQRFTPYWCSVRGHCERIGEKTKQRSCDILYSVVMLICGAEAELPTTVFALFNSRSRLSSAMFSSVLNWCFFTLFCNIWLYVFIFKSALIEDYEILAAIFKILPFWLVQSLKCKCPWDHRKDTSILPLCWNSFVGFVFWRILREFYCIHMQLSVLNQNLSLLDAYVSLLLTLCSCVVG